MRTLPMLVTALGLTTMVAAAAPGAVDLTGSWEVSFDCGIYATATSFVTIVADPATGALTMSTPPLDCGTVEVPGGIYGVGSCASTPDPRDGLLNGTTLDSPTIGYYTSDARTETPFQFSFTSCAVARIVSAHHFSGAVSVEQDDDGEPVRITGTVLNGSLLFYDTNDSVCFSLPDAPDCQFEMRPNDVDVGTSVTVSPHAGVAVTFETVTGPGTASVTPLSTPSATVPGDFHVYTVPGFLGGPPVPIFYDIHTTATIGGSITSCFTYRDADQNGFVDATTPPLRAADLRLLHAESGTFVDRTLSLDTTTHVICGRTASLSQVVLGAGPAASPPPPSSPSPPSLRDQPVSGRRLKLVRRRAGQRLHFESDDPSLPFPAPGSADDLRRVGAELDVFSPGLGSTDLVLPAGEWRMRKRGSAYVFGGAGGRSTIELALTKTGPRLTIDARTDGTQRNVPFGTVAVRLTTGRLRTCALFGHPSVRRDRTGTFLAGSAPAPAVRDCSDASLLTQ